MTLDRERAVELQIVFTREFLRWLGDASPGASAVDGAGLTAAVVPAAPERSIVNSVGFDSFEALAESYDDVRAAYRGAGTRAWIAWAPEDDVRSRAFLAAREHVNDGEPVAMISDLGAFEPLPLGDLDWDAGGEGAELGELNDLAYGYEPSSGIGRALEGAQPGGSFRIYRARVDGVTASVLGTLDVGDDAGILFVATPPEYQGRGLASRLLSAALTEARDRGMGTSSLQASAKGAPIYERLGYESYFRFHLLERREDAG